MKKLLVTTLCAAALAAAPVASGIDQAQATHKLGHALLGGLIAGAVIGSIVRANQNHCHGNVCHTHAQARANHFHDAYGTILYQAPQPTYVVPAPPPPPPPAYGGSYSANHYNWCYAKYRSYHQPSNSYQPYGYAGRRQCVSPYM
ncbi:MAG: BA14K family protein [Rhizobiaceae bacterium]